MMVTEKHRKKAERLIKRLSPSMVVRELCQIPETLSESIDAVIDDDVLEPLSQEEAEMLVLSVLDNQRRDYLKFKVSKETMMERYYDLYSRALDANDVKAAKSILDKIASELGLSVDSEISVSNQDKIILKIE